MNSKQAFSALLKLASLTLLKIPAQRTAGMTSELAIELTVPPHANSLSQPQASRPRHPRGGLIGGLFYCLFILATPVNAQSIYQEKMLRLNAENNSASQVETLADYQGKTLLTSFFMPNCRWCQRQHKVLKKMQHSCPDLHTVMLGVQGSKQKLRHELQREKNTFPAFLANKNIINAVGSKSPVPMMLIFDNQGKLAFKTVGYTPEKKLKSLLNQHKVNICTA